MVRYAADLLGRGGKLVQAVAAWEAVTPQVAQLRVTRRSLVERCPELYARRVYAEVGRPARAGQELSRAVSYR